MYILLGIISGSNNFMVKTNSSSQIHGVGRRKKSVARVWMKPGKGKIEVNGQDYTSYFHTDFARQAVLMPLKVCGFNNMFDAKINCAGGGQTGQSDAAKLGIARALLSTDESLRRKLRESGLLTVDSRIKERKKPGQPAARKKFQFVKR